jgi:hypothetical protein
MESFIKGLINYILGIFWCVKEVALTIWKLLCVLINMPLHMIYCMFCKDMTYDEWYEYTTSKEEES